MKKLITKMSKGLGIGLIVGLVVIGSGKVWGQVVTLTANTSSTASGLYGLSTSSGPVTYTSGSGNSLITVQTIAATINQKNQTPTAGCFGTSRVYLISSASGGQIKISLPNSGDYYLDKVELLLSSNSTGATLSGVGANGHYRWIQADGTTYSSSSGIGGLTGYDQYTTICSSPITATAVVGAKAMVFGRGSIGGINVSGAEFRIWQIKVWIKQVISCTAPVTKTVSGTTTICAGSSTNVTLGESQSGVTYQLYAGASPSGSAVAGTGSNLIWSVSPSTTTTYTVKTTTADGYCETTMSGSAVVIVNALPTPTFTAAPTTSARFTNVTYTTQTGQSSYVWSMSGIPDTDYSIVSGGGTSDNSVTLQWLTAGSKTVSVNYTNAGGCSAAGATSTGTEVTLNLAPPTLNAASNVTVDAPFDVTFTDDASWRAAVTDVTVGGVSLAGSAYGFSAGTLTLNPANDSKLQSAGSKSIIVIADGYNNASFSQSVSAGVVSQWSISTQPVAPNANHGALATQPVINFKDQYNNSTGSGSVTASASSGWTLGGTTTVNASSGVAAFSGLTASTADYSALEGATITFVTSGLSNLTSNAFNIPGYSTGANDYFRTKGTGNWHDIATWESSPDNSSWFNATSYPDANSNTVNILHNIIYNGTPATVGNVIVNTGLTLTNTTTAISVASGKTLTISSGSVFENQASISNAISAGIGSIQVNGTYKITAVNASSSALSFTNIIFSSGALLNVSGTSNVRIPATCNYNVEWSSTASNSFVNSASNSISGNLTISNAAAVLNNGTGGSGRAVTVSGNLIISAGQYNPQGGTGATQSLIVNGNVIISGSGKLYAVNPSVTGVGSVTIKSNVEIQNPVSLEIGQGGGSSATLSFAGTSNQTISTNQTTGYTLSGFTLNNSSGLTLGSDLTVSGNLTLTAGSITTELHNLTLTGQISGAGTINTASGTLTFAGASEQTLAAANVTAGAVNNLVVNAGTKLTTSGAILAGNLSLQSNESGTATLTGTLTTTNATIQQYLPSARNFYVSSPFNSHAAPVSAVTRYYEYIEPGDNVPAENSDATGATAYWKGFTPASLSMTKGKGYIAQVNAPATFTYIGGSINGNVSVPLTRTAGKTKSGFNLIGNPYTAYLDWSAVSVANANIQPTLYMRTRSSSAYVFASVNVATPASPIVVANNANTTVTKLIPPLQGFWVRLNDNQSTGNLALTTEMLAHRDQTGNSVKAPAAPLQLLRLQVSNGTHIDESVICFTENASNSFDRYDSPKMSNNNAAIPEIFTSAGSEELVINGMNSYNYSTSIPLGLRTGESNTFTISATQVQSFDADTRIVLVDHVSNAQTDLTAGENYTFTSEPTTGSTRFSILFKSATGTTSVENPLAGLKVYTNDNKMLIDNFNVQASAVSVSIFNGMGQQLHEQILTGQHTEIDRNFTPGVYMVKVSGNGVPVTQKVVIR